MKQEKNRQTIKLEGYTGGCATMQTSEKPDIQKSGHIEIQYQIMNIINQKQRDQNQKTRTKS